MLMLSLQREKLCCAERKSFIIHLCIAEREPKRYAELNRTLLHIRCNRFNTNGFGLWPWCTVPIVDCISRCDDGQHTLAYSGVYDIILSQRMWSSTAAGPLFPCSGIMRGDMPYDPRPHCGPRAEQRDHHCRRGIDTGAVQVLLVISHVCSADTQSYPGHPQAGPTINTPPLALCAQPSYALTWIPFETPLINHWCTWAVFDVARGRVALGTPLLLNTSRAWLQVPSCSTCGDDDVHSLQLGGLTGDTTTWVAGACGFMDALPTMNKQLRYVVPCFVCVFTVFND